MILLNKRLFWLIAITFTLAVFGWALSVMVKDNGSLLDKNCRNICGREELNFIGSGKTNDTCGAVCICENNINLSFCGVK